MKNFHFQDVLEQRYLNYGPLWCDDGVYRIAKELQLLNPSLIEKIFLGPGGFQVEKNLNILLWQLPPRVWNWKCVCWEWNIWSRTCSVSFVWRAQRTWQKGMMMLAETLQQLCSSKNIYAPTQDHLQDSQHIEAFKTMLTNASPNESAEWKYNEVKMKGLIHSIGDFKNAGCQKSNQFKFWCVFLQDVVSFLIDTNRSHREGNWDMDLSAVRRAIPLFFFLNRINYKH